LASAWAMHPVGWLWGAWGLAMMLGTVAFWFVLITALVVGTRWLTRVAGGGRRDRALEILRERYTRGEIDRQEFEARRRDLEVS